MGFCLVRLEISLIQTELKTSAVSIETNQKCGLGLLDSARASPGHGIRIAALPTTSRGSKSRWFLLIWPSLSGLSPSSPLSRFGHFSAASALKTRKETTSPELQRLVGQHRHASGNLRASTVRDGGDLLRGALEDIERRHERERPDGPVGRPPSGV